MNHRTLAIGVLILASLVMLAGIVTQRRHISGLRAEHQRLLDQTAAPADAESAASNTANSSSGATDARSSDSTSELLRLRSQVSQLTERKRDLPQARAENEALHAKLATRSSQGSGGIPIPPGYIRFSEAQWTDLSTPENTVQAFLWAVRNRDAARFMQTLTPEFAEKMKEQIDSTKEDFFKNASFPGMRVINQEQLEDGFIKAQLEIVPGAPPTDALKVFFRRIDGQWKMNIP